MKVRGQYARVARRSETLPASPRSRIPHPRHRIPGFRLPVLLLAAAAGAVFLGGCAPARRGIAGEERRSASEFFAAAAAVSFPIEASFSGIAEIYGRAVPFVAGVSSRGPGDESAGIYDPLGRGVIFLANGGGRLAVTRGPAGADFLTGDLPRIPDGGLALDAGPVSVGRILAGAPAFPVTGGTPARTGDGGWVLEDGRQTLYSDPSRRVLARAVYEISGRRLTVSYPDRASPAPPRLVRVELFGTKIVLRRDTE